MDLKIHVSPFLPCCIVLKHGTSILQHLARQGNLKELRSLQECVEFIHHWKEQVDQVCKVEPTSLHEIEHLKQITLFFLS